MPEQMPQTLYHIGIGFGSLKDWRAAQRLSQMQAAEIFGISPSLWSKLERRTQYARGPLAKRIAETTGIPLAVLVGAA